MGRPRRLDERQLLGPVPGPNVNGVGSETMPRSPSPFALIVISMLFWVVHGALADQPTPPTVDATASSPGSAARDVPASTVSPVIERFMKQSGQTLPPPPPRAFPVKTRRPAGAIPYAAINCLFDLKQCSGPRGSRRPARGPASAGPGPNFGRRRFENQTTFAVGDQHEAQVRTV